MVSSPIDGCTCWAKELKKRKAAQCLPAEIGADLASSCVHAINRVHNWSVVGSGESCTEPFGPEEDLMPPWPHSIGVDTSQNLGQPLLAHS